MTVKVWEKGGIPSTYVEAVYHRIVAQLPVITGLSVTDVEVDLLFGKSRTALVEVADTRYFPDVIECTCDILDDLNKNDKYVPLPERKKLSLRSIAIVLRLLSDLCELNWKAKESLPVRYLKRQVSSNVLTSVSGIGSASHRLNYYTTTPDSIPIDLAKRALSAITRLKSSRETLMKMLEIQGKKFKEKENHNYILLENIDINCLSIVRFISAANPGEVLSWMQSKISVLFSQSSEESDYAPYLDFLAHIQVVDVWLMKYLELVLYSIDKIRKPIHLQLILYFSSQSIRFWLMSNPESFINNIKKGSSIPLLANSLFDGLHSKLPDFLSARGTSVFACLLMVLAPKTFEDYMNSLNSNSSKLKQLTGTTKQLQFLKSIVKQVTTRGPLLSEYSSCMVTIMLLAGSVKRHDPNSALYRFSLLYTDDVFDTLSMSDPTKYCIGSDPTIIDGLRVEFFVASTTLLDQKYTEKYVEMIKDPNATLLTLRVLTGGMKSLSTNPAARSTFNQMLKGCSINLRELLLKTCDILRSDDFECISSPVTPSVDKSKDEFNLSLTNSKSSSASDASASTPRSPQQFNYPDKSSVLSQRNNKKDSLSSFRINRHKLDMKKHMSFKLNNTGSSTSNSNFSSSSPSSQTSVPQLSLDSSHSSSQSIKQANYQTYYTIDTSDLRPEYYKDIVKNLFSIFRSQPIAYLLPSKYTPEDLDTVLSDQKLYCELREEIESVIAPYAYLYAESDIEIVESLTHFAFGIVERLSRSPTPQLALFYNFSCVTILKSLAGMVSEYILDDSKAKKLLNILVLFMESRHKALEELEPSTLSLYSSVHAPYICRDSFTSLEKAFMSGFLIPDLDTFRLIKRGLNLLLLDSRLVHQPECFIDMNFEFYKAIVDDNSTITSLTAVQKKIKRNFFDKVFPTTGLIQVWHDLYNKWSLEKTEDSAFHLGYIVSMAGVLINTDNKDDEVRQSVIEKIKFVISSQIELLTLDDFKTREAAKDILSTEMSPVCYVYVIDHISEKSREILEHGTPTDKDLILIDQFTLITRLIVHADASYVYMLMTAILEAVMCWCQIIDSAQDDVMKLKLKLRHAKLGQNLDGHKSKYANWGLLKLRNAFARIYLDWTEAALFRNSDDTNSTKVISVGADTNKLTVPVHSKKAKELEMLSFDVGVECSSVLSSLLERLPLETPQAIHAKELKRSRKMIFGNYFSVLYKILDKFNSTGSANDMSLSSKHKVSVLVENAVTGLTNLLDSNVDVGFEFALPLNFHDDRKIKLSFLKVFANIVDKLNVHDDGTDQKSLAITKVLQIVMSYPQLTLAVSSFCQPSDVDSLALTFLNGSDDQAKVLSVLSTLIKLEIMTAKNSSEILRSNSVATRMLALFCKKEGSEYLEKTLKPTLSRIADLQDNFEVEKLTVDDPNAEENVEKFMFYLNEIVNLLFQSIDYIPNEFKYLCSVIYEATGKVFPDAKIYAVGAFMFLRLIAPAIVSPDANEIITVNTDRALKRSFIQLAKVLQLMANSSITTIRWPLLLSRMNELTILNVQITRFLQAVSKFHAKNDLIRTANMSTAVDDTFFHHLIYNNLDKIRSHFVSNPSLPLNTKRDIYALLDEALCEAGQPLSLFGYTISDFVNDKEDPENALYEFMTKTSMKEINFTVRDNIVHETISPDGVPAVVLNYGCLENTSLEDAELIMFRFYQVASKLWDSKFYLIIDTTGFTADKEFTKTLFKLFEAYTPSVVFKNMARIYFYNVSQKFYPSVLQSLKFMQDHNYLDNVYFASSFDRANFGFGLSALTSSLIEDVRVTFHDVSLYEVSQNRFVPVTVKIGDEFLQVGFRQPTRFKAFGSMKAVTLTDVYPIADLSGAEISNITGVPDEICINNSVDGSKLILTSPKKIEIMRTIYFSKSRYSAFVERQKEQEDDDNQRLDNWLGELINIDFVGLLSHDEEVRKASYVLLCSLGKSFKLDLGTYFESSTQVSFPQSNVSFVISNAKLLAENHQEYTYEIVNGFFNAYKHCEEYQRISAIMYISPFIKYLFSAVDNESDFRRDERTSILIRKFIEVSTLQEGPLVAFHSHIWSQLTLQDKVAAVLIEEAVAASIDREAEGKRWDDIISLVTLTPTLKICSSVIQRLRELSYISKLNPENSIATHTSWIEITVLVKVCVALFFDSTLFTEMFMPDIIYISTIFMDVGPFELRASLYKLLLNVFHSALLKEDLTKEKRERATLIVNKFHDQRIKMLLGLNREEHRNSLIESDSDIFSRISALEMLCDSLFEFINLVGDEEIANVWRSRWHSLAVDAAFSHDSILQDRAFLILGFLSKHGVTDILINKILGTMVIFGENLVDKKSFNSVLCSIYALSRAVQGITPRSPYSEKFYWLALTLNYNNNILFAHPAVQLLGNALVAVDKRGKFINGEVIKGIFDTRSIFANTIESYEAAYDVHVSPANIDLVIISLFIRDLQAPFTKSVAVDALCNSFIVRVNNALLREKLTGITSDRHCLIYGVILFTIARNNVEFLEVVSKSDLDSSEMTVMDEGLVAPTRMIEFLLTESDLAILTLMKASTYIISEAADEISQLRFLVLYKYISERSERIKWMIYPEIRPALRKLSVSSNSPPLLGVVFEIAKAAIVYPEYQQLGDFAEQMNDLVKKYDLLGVRDLKFDDIHSYKLSHERDMPSNVKAPRVALIVEMIKRIISSVVPDD